MPSTKHLTEERVLGLRKQVRRSAAQRVELKHNEHSFHCAGNELVRVGLLFKEGCHGRQRNHKL